MRRHALPLLLTLLLTLANCSSGPAELPAAAPAEAGAGVLMRNGQAIQVGTFAIDRALVVSPDGAVKETRRLTATDQFAAYWRGQVDAIQEAARRGWSLDTRDEGVQMVIVMAKDYETFAEFNRETGGELEVVEHPLFQKVVFKQSMVFDPAVLARELPPPQGSAGEEWTRFLAGQVRWTQQVTMPSRVTSHNMDGVSGNTVTWARAAGKIPGQADLTAESRVYRTLPLAIALGVGLLLVGGPLAIRLTRRWWDQEAE